MSPVLCGDRGEFQQIVFMINYHLIDLLPTFAKMTGKNLPSDRKIDGVDASDLPFGKGTSGRKSLHYTSRGELEGIRSGNWKLLRKNPEGRP